MKTLLLLRHAKSSWDDPALRDFDRPLNARGHKAAPLMGWYLRQRQIELSLVVCSLAQRAKETAELFFAAARLNHVELRFDARIYDAAPSDLMRVISEFDDGAECVLLIGHNPGLEEILQRLTGEFRRMPTASLAHIELDLAHWAETRENVGRLNWLKRPKELQDE
ncbi:MAG: SixA phosphatase family protein [Pyrinomonadaceae bacterium]